MRPFLVIGVGGSAGGLEACVALLGALPAEAPLALVVIHHGRQPGPTLLPKVLGCSSALPVGLIVRGMPLTRGRVYVRPAGYELTLSAGGDGFALRALSKPWGWPTVVSVFLESLARECGARAVAVILSGAGFDGADALHGIHEAGGTVFAQEPGTAQVSTMPLNAIASGHVDRVLTPAQIGRELLRLALKESAGRSPHCTRWPPRPENLREGEREIPGG
jgi:two-component system, chemotaxis family, protein-glutamate methylesterase/glutaminase